jgi:hypothetical protein
VSGTPSVVNAPKLSSHDHLLHPALHARDEVDQRRVTDEAAVRVVGVDDHDGVRGVALDEALQLAEVEAEAGPGVEPVRHDGPDGELVVSRERRQAEDQRPRRTAEERLDDLAGSVGDAELLRGHAGVGRKQRGDRSGLRRVVGDHPLELPRRDREQPRHRLGGRVRVGEKAGVDLDEPGQGALDLADTGGMAA